MAEEEKDILGDDLELSPILPNLNYNLKGELRPSSLVSSSDVGEAMSREDFEDPKALDKMTEMWKTMFE